MAENPFLDIDQKMLGDTHTSSEPMDNLTVLCDDFGSRFGGTAGERQAADFFRNKFREYGLRKPRKERYRYASWSRGVTTLEIVEPIHKEIPCIALPYCPSGTLEAELVSVGNGMPSDFDAAGRRLREKIVMATSASSQDHRFVHRSEKYARSALAGASGFIFMNHYDGLGPATGSIADNQEAIMPGISVSKEDGSFLQRLMARKGNVTLKLKTRNRTAEKTSWNVVAELPGNEHPDQWVMAGCHYDGHDISQGANDPVSGMVCVQEAARVLKKYAAARLGCGIRFVAFGTEEIGLIGAKNYVQQHADELDQIRLYINMDSAGGVGRKGIVMHRRPELDETFSVAKTQMKYDMPYGQGMSAFSDHFPFFEAGVPTCGMGDVEGVFSGRGYGHTAHDTLDKIKLADLREASSVLSRLLLRISCAETWPAKRWTTSKAARMMKKDASLEIVKVEADLAKLYRRKSRTRKK
ncbi:MAG: M28 family peptidase [Candidatus Latescibacterota bacterium]|nr:M28 family peptidase [Candidatus Latescibacterota bacterium]